MIHRYSLAQSIQACRKLAYASNSNFLPAFSFLPHDKREAMFILYAYNRFTDDLVDSPDINPETGEALPVSPRRKRQKLNQWIKALEVTLGEIGGLTPLIRTHGDEAAFSHLEEQFVGCQGLIYLPALKMIVEQFRIPIEALFHLFDGVEADIEPQTFETFDSCADYCHQVATSVGFASLAIWGTTEPLFSERVVKAAKACGIAFQWTNILRDLFEDLSQGRVYLPQNEIRFSGLTVNQIKSILDRQSWLEQKRKPKDLPQAEQFGFNEMRNRMEDFEERFLKLMTRQLERCEIYYDNAAPLYGLIDPKCRKTFGIMWSSYYTLFQELRKYPFGKGTRIRLSFAQRLKLLLRWKCLPCRRLK